MANDDLHCGICHGETDGIFRIGTWTSASIKVGKSALIKRRKCKNEFFQKLKQDHQQLKGILGELKESKESPLKKREELFQKLRRAGASYEGRGKNLLSTLDGKERGP
jgi:hypothetical protein